MEVYKILPEGTLAELIDGIIYMSPAPSLRHQEITTTLVALFYLFSNESKSGQVFAPPVDVFFDDTSNAVQPDLVFVLEKNRSILKEDAIHGVPDLIVEILSPGTRDHDLEKKKELYQRFRVGEYWIIDPQTKEATGYRLGLDFQYIEFFRSKGQLRSHLLDHTFTFA